MIKHKEDTPQLQYNNQLFTNFYSNKMVYFAENFFYTTYDKRLINDQTIAFPQGPVYNTVFKYLKNFNYKDKHYSNKIDKNNFITTKNLTKNEIESAILLPEEVKKVAIMALDVVNNIHKKYGSKGSYEFIKNITHDDVWKKARQKKEQIMEKQDIKENAPDLIKKIKEFTIENNKT